MELRREGRLSGGWRACARRFACSAVASAHGARAVRSRRVCACDPRRGSWRAASMRYWLHTGYGMRTTPPARCAGPEDTACLASEDSTPLACTRHAREPAPTRPGVRCAPRRRRRLAW